MSRRPWRAPKSSTQVEHPKRTDYAKPFALPNPYAVAVIHEHEIGRKRSSQDERGFFAIVEPLQRWLIERLASRCMHLQPRWRFCYPVTNRFRRFNSRELTANNGGNDDFFE
jgi:hypothetical protein